MDSSALLLLFLSALVGQKKRGARLKSLAPRKFAGFSVSSETMFALLNVAASKVSSTRFPPNGCFVMAERNQATAGSSGQTRSMSEASHPASQHFVVPFLARAQSVQHPAQVEWRQVQGAVATALGLPQPGVPDEPFEFRQFVRRELTRHGFHFSECTHVLPR